MSNPETTTPTLQEAISVKTRAIIDSDTSIRDEPVEDTRKETIRLVAELEYGNDGNRIVGIFSRHLKKHPNRPPKFIVEGSRREKMKPGKYVNVNDDIAVSLDKISGKIIVDNPHHKELYLTAVMTPETHEPYDPASDDPNEILTRSAH
jgi:hypothetical protein